MGKRNRITASQVMGLVKRQSFTCPISGRPLTPETASLDHIMPLGRGGEHALSNVWVVDQQANIAKGTMTMEEFMELCRDIVACQNLGKVKTAPQENLGTL